MARVIALLLTPFIVLGAVIVGGVVLFVQLCSEVWKQK